MSILFHHYKEVKECVNQVEQMEDTVNDSSKQRLIDQGSEKGGRIRNTIAAITPLDSYLEM
jgi:hypothetical protein